MLDFLGYYKNPDEDRINKGLIDRSYDKDILYYIVDASKSLEVIPNIKFLSYKFTDDEKKIDINDYITSRSTSTKDINNKYIYLHDDRMGELQLKFLITGVDREGNEQKKIINKKILLPLADENGYFTMKGKKFYLIYQLVDSSTYNTTESTVLKTLLGVEIKRHFETFADSDGNEHSIPHYTITMFRKDRPIFQFFFATMGVEKTLKYFGVSDVMRFTNAVHDNEKFIYFPISSKFILEVDREMFENHKYIKSVVAMIKVVCSNRIKESNYENKLLWVEKIGSAGTIKAENYLSKGYQTLTFLSRMIDETTKKILRIDKSNKKDIYAIMRWMVQNYDQLRSKDNHDLSNKRLRYSELVGAIYTYMLSERLNRIVSNNSYTVEEIEKIFNFPSTKLKNEITKSGLLRFDDKINDLDIFMKLKYSIKGINSIGNKNSKKIGKPFRTIQPSMLGKVDMTAVGNSDPGTSGVLTPFIKTDGLYLSDKTEPQSFRYELENQINDKLRDEGYLVVEDYNDEKSFYEREERYNEVINTIKIKTTENDCELVIELGSQN